MNQTESESKPAARKSYAWLKACAGFLGGCVAAIALSLNCTRGATNQPPSASVYIAQVASAIKGFEADHYGSTPEMANLETFREMVRPYLRESFLFYDPVDFKPLVPNPALSRVDMFELSHPESTVLIYDGRGTNGRRVVGYADGRVRSISETQFQKDLAQTPHLRHSLGLYVGKWQTPYGEVTIDDKGLATLKGVTGKSLSGKASVDESGSFSLTFGSNAPAIIGKVTWLSINEVSIKPAGKESVLISRVQ